MKRKEYLASIRRGLEYLKNAPKTVFDPYPNYPAEVYEVLGLLPPDYDYLAHYDSMDGKPVSEMTKSNIATKFTFIIRGERFCDGHIASYVDSGELYALLCRLAELEGIAAE